MIKLPLKQMLKQIERDMQREAELARLLSKATMLLPEKDRKRVHTLIKRGTTITI